MKFPEYLIMGLVEIKMSWEDISSQKNNCPGLFIWNSKIGIWISSNRLLPENIGLTDWLRLLTKNIGLTITD